MKKLPPPLTPEMLDAMLEVTHIENAPMIRALHDVLIRGARPSPTAALHGVSRQVLERRLNHIVGKIKPAFDTYAILVHAELTEAGANFP